MITGFIRGSFAYVEAIRLASKYRLWAYVWLPGLLSLFLGAGIFYSAYSASDDIGQWVVHLYPFDWGRAVIEGISQVFGGIFVAIVGLLFFKHLVLALSAPVMSLLSEKVESRLLGKPAAVPFSFKKALSDLARGLTLAVRNLLRELFYTGLLLLLGFFFPVLSPVLALLIFWVQAFYAGFGNLDFTLERHRDVRGSVAFARSHRGLCLGNGTVFLLLLFTIAGFLFALPLGTIAATREAVRALEAGELEGLVE